MEWSENAAKERHGPEFFVRNSFLHHTARPTETCLLYSEAYSPFLLFFRFYIALIRLQVVIEVAE